MGGERVADEVGEAVADVTVSSIKSNNEKKDGKKEEAEKMCVDTEDGVKGKNKEVNVDQKDVEVSKDHKEEEKEVNGIEEEGKDERKEEAKSDAMEVDGVGDANEQRDDKIVQIADSKDTEGSEKRATKKSGGEKGKNKKETDEKKNNNEPKTPVGPAIDRPVRERKSVERLVAVIDNDTAKEFRIEKGRGTALKDIPNVAYKLSRKKVPEDTLKLLHTVLFVRRGKALEIKSNILRFSGFVWHENEEKQKAKVQEKLDKFNKEKLFEFCDLLDIPVTKTTARKDDVITKLVDFLLAPHATTSELLAEKEQSSKGSKRKRPHKTGASSSKATLPKDSSKKSKSASEKQKGTPETEDSEEEDESDEHQVNGRPVKSESSEHVSEPESEEEDVEKRTLDSKKPPKTESASKTKSKNQASDKKSNPEMKTATESSAKLSKPKDQSDSHPPTKTFSRKKKNHLPDEKTLSPRKSASKEKSGKKDVKEKEAPKEEKLKPSDANLKAAVCDILNEVDFNTATFNDILKLLSEQFRTDLTPRKATIKSAIHEELSKIAEEEEDETDTEDGGKQAPARKASRA